jgi:hypothetical protein
MDRIPLKILVHIVRMAGESCTSWDRPVWKERQRTLLSASLVARRWRRPALEELWGTLWIKNGQAWEAIMNSPALGRYRSLAVCVHRLSAMQSVLLLARCMGVKELYLRRILGVGSTLLSLP